MCAQAVVSSIEKSLKEILVEKCCRVECYGSEKEGGYNLVDAGYDVWLGNNRGNSYSRKHVNLTTSNKKYWDFRFTSVHVQQATGQKHSVCLFPALAIIQGQTLQCRLEIDLTSRGGSSLSYGGARPSSP
uniref:Uncharacterized protein n=1 Tax=Timema cristinae TaxID=61476 RepID=A0A7R9CLM5_TIMCR|nr:unnamed protein product [Timema cristinae]